MAGFQQKLSELTVTVTSPDGKIKARLVGGEDLTLGFRSGTYKRYSEDGLAHQLARLGTLAWTGYHRGWLQALGESRGEVYTNKPEHWNTRNRAYQEALEEVVAHGKSSGGYVEAKAKGLMEWKFKIKPGTVEKVDEQTFINEVQSTFRDLQLDSKRHTILLKQKHLGLAIPPSWRAKAPE